MAGLIRERWLAPLVPALARGNCLILAATQALHPTKECRAMLPAPVRDFLDVLAGLSLAEWRRVSASWADLDPRSYDTADRSMIFAIQARQMAQGSAGTTSPEVMELDAEIVRVVNAMRFLARDGERVGHVEVNSMRAAAIAAGFALLARQEIDEGEFRTLLAPFEPWIAA